MMWKARTLRLNPTSQVTGSTPSISAGGRHPPGTPIAIVKNGMHQPGYPLIHCPECLGCLAEGEDVSAQLCQRQYGQQLNGLPAAARPGPGPGQPSRHRRNLSAADDQ